MFESTETKILFIARNIPTPNRKSNAIILKLAKQLEAFYDITILYPSEWVPWGIHFIPKYKPEYGLKSFDIRSMQVQVFKYKRLPISGNILSLSNNLNSKIIDFFLHGGYKIIHAHFLFPDGWFAFLLHQQFNTPFIITVRGSCYRYLTKIKKTSNDYKKAVQVLANASKILVLNKIQQDYLADNFNIYSQLIPHGIESSFFSKEKKIEEEEIIKIITIGEAIEQKNIQWVIRAVKEYDGEKKIQLDILGDGSFLNQLKELSKGIDKIKFHGQVDRTKVKKMLEDSHIFALPSINETFGLVFVEAAATKNLVIAKKYDGVWGVFDEEEVLFCEDFDSFKRLLHQGITSFELRKRMSNLAYSKAESFQWDKILDQYKMVYKDSLNSSFISK